MDIEVIIMLAFLGVIVVGTPITVYLIQRDTKRMEREEAERKKNQAR